VLVTLHIKYTALEHRQELFMELIQTVNHTLIHKAELVIRQYADLSVIGVAIQIISINSVEFGYVKIQVVTEILIMAIDAEQAKPLPTELVILRQIKKCRQQKTTLVGFCSLQAQRQFPVTHSDVL
jgi:hypothetical protein